MSSALPFQCGSPLGMGQLIKYFESQSRRLDKQTIAPEASCLNSDFESMIKFNGVPILPPAMTLSRREELRQLKKNAILLEKRQNVRQGRHHVTKADPQMSYPETSPRPAARQLNFDSEADRKSNLPDRIGATNPLSTFATAEMTMVTEEFGLQTMDSVNSDFMSLEQDSIPRVFAGLALTSVKEQKISYDLDRLSKVLNVQDMTSTSGSDLSDALGNTQTLGEEDLQDAQRLAQKFLHNSKTSGTGDGQMLGFFQESQDTVVEVSPEPGAREDVSTSGFVDNTTTETSIGSSPGCGSANTTGTTDSQRSSRSSPKSLKNAVHFASFLTEYNTTTSQLFERPMIIKKKMPYEQSVDHTWSNMSSEGVAPIICDPSETRQRNAYKNAGGENKSTSLLNRVTLNPDSDSSPVTPPFDPTSGIPFQNFGKFEPGSSDKENDASHSHASSTQGHKRSPDRPGRSGFCSQDQTSVEVSHRWSMQRRGYDRTSPSLSSPDAGSRDYKSDDSSRRRAPPHTEIQSQPHSLPVAGATFGVGPLELPRHVDEVGARESVSSCTQDEDVAMSSAVVPSGVVTVGQISVSDSQGSNRSTTLTGGTSESSSSTIKDDLSARESGNLSMNIVVVGHGTVSMDAAHEEKQTTGSAPASIDHDVGSANDKTPTNVVNEIVHSPKKLNTDNTISPSPASEEKPEIFPDTPPQEFVRKGSYTLSKPSPALLKARARYQEATEKHNIPVSEDVPQTDKSILDTSSARPMSDSNKTCEAARGLNALEKLPTVNIESTKQSSHSINTSDLSGFPEEEREGKAEHINKYLSQVQFQNSMNLSCQSWDGADRGTATDNDVPGFARLQNQGEKGQEGSSDGKEEMAGDLLSSVEDVESIGEHVSVLDVLKSMAESVGGSKDRASVSNLLSIHQQQMDRERQTLIQQQQRDMEELFVQQRRDMLLLEAEIKAAQQMEKDQQEFLVQNLPENIKVKAHNHDGEFSPEHTGTFQHPLGGSGESGCVLYHTGAAPTVPDAVHSLDNRRPQSVHHRPIVSSDDGEFRPQLQPKSFPGANPGKPVQFKAKKASPYPLLKKGKVMPYSPQSAWEESQTYVKTIADDSFSPRAGNPIRIPGFSPAASSPGVHRPLKSTAMHRRDEKISVPPEAHTPEMRANFERVTAVAKGFLCRCLLKSDKVQELIKTIKDTREFAFNFQTETPVKKGVFTPQDRALLERIVAQLQAALMDIHEIFFEIPCAERMALIEQTRAKEYDKRVKMSRDSLRGSGPRISQATLKALERKRKAKEAEASVIVSTSRPRTAPSATRSPRCQNHTDIRALKPLQGQTHHKPDVPVTSKQDCSRSEKDRPRTAPAKQLTRPKRIAALSTKHMNTPSTSQEVSKDSPKEGTNKQNPTAATKVVTKTKGASVKSVSSRPGKSWR